MVALTQQEQQVVEWFRALPPERRRQVMLAMGRAEADGWRRYQGQGEQRFRALAAARGLDWDALDDGARQEFANERLHDRD